MNLYSELSYYHRIQLALICTLVVMNIAFRITTRPFISTVDSFRDISASEQVSFREVEITVQKSAPAAPSTPQVPVPVPDHEIIEEEEFDLTSLINDNFPEQSEFTGMGTSEEEAKLVKSPDQPPGLKKIVEPIVPKEAKNAGVKARIYVSFLVDEKGNVADVSVSRIELFDPSSGRFKVVNHVGYGLMGATMEAASRWKFKPARHNGKPVKTYTRQVFTFGV